MKIFTLLSFTTPPYVKPSDKGVNLNVDRTPPRGSSRKHVRTLSMVACAIIAMSLLAGCKATSTLTVTLREKVSGTIDFTLELDKEAASILRRDSYNTTTLSAVFDSKKLQDAGFEVEVKDNTDGNPSVINLRADFSNQEQLRAGLAVLAPRSVLDASVVSETTFTNEKQNATITVDVSHLRDLYLNDADVRTAVEKSGMEFSEFETLVNSALKSTSLKVVLKQSGNQDTANVTGESVDKEKLAVSQNVFRSRFIGNLVAAIAAAAVAFVLIARFRRTSALVSPQKQQKMDS